MSSVESKERPPSAVERSGDAGRAWLPAGFDLGAVACWALSIALVAFLAFNNGGYDLLERSEAGLAAWWIVLVATVAGALAPITRLSVAGRALVVLLALFAGWTALSLGWTESAERSMIELGKVATYLGFFVLGLGMVAAGYGRQVLNGVAVGIAAVIVAAALSRLEPSWFPSQNVGEFLPDQELERRLAYPLNYSTGLAVLGAMGLPLFLFLATAARTLAGRCLAVAVLPVVALTLWLTGSSLSVPVGALALLAYLVLTTDRIAALASLLLGALGAAVLVLMASGREALDRGLPTPEAFQEGDEMLVIALVVSAVMILGRFLLERGLRRWPERPSLSIPPRAARAALVAGVAVLALALATAAVSGELADRWDAFTSAEGLDPNEEDRGAQVLDVSARGRYQYWEAAVDAYRTEPALGIGPGTFEFWWAREGDPAAAIFVRDAHSLLLETLAELGPLGLVLISVFVALVLLAGAVRAIRAGPELRPLIAAAVAACLAFAAAAALDWIWELAVLPAVFVLLAAVASTGALPRPAGGVTPARGEAPAATRRSRGVFGRALTAVVSIAALVAIAIPFAGAAAVEESRDEIAGGSLDAALSSAREASSIQPYAATPRIQEAVVLEQLGFLDEAVAAAREATEREATNWRLWLVLSRLEARTGDAPASVDALGRAEALFPRGLNQLEQLE